MNKLDKAIEKVKSYMVTNNGKVTWYKAVELIDELKKAGWVMPTHQTVEQFIKLGGTITKLPYFAYEEEIDIDVSDSCFISY